MTVRLNITLDVELYRRLKKELPPKGISAFIGAAVEAQLRPSKRALEASYQAASRDQARKRAANDWQATEVERWPD